MAKVEIEQNYTESLLQKYNITDTIIQKMNDKYMNLSVNGVTDIQGYNAVREARKIVSKVRIEVERTRKELKDESLQTGRLIDNEAKRITALLSPIESHLQEQENIVAKEQERQAQLLADAKKAKIQARITNLMEAGMNFDPITHFYTLGEEKIHTASVEVMQDEEFDKTIQRVIDTNEKIQLREAEKLRLAQEETDRLNKQCEEQEAERIRLKNIRKEQEENDRLIREVQAKKEAELKAESDRIENEKREIEHAKQIEIAKEQARLQSIEDEKKRVADEAKIQEAKAKADKLEAERLKALQPDKDKLLEFSKVLSKLEFPTVKSREAKSVIGICKIQLNDIIKKLNTDLKTL